MQVTISDGASPVLKRVLDKFTSPADREKMHRIAAFAIETAVRKHLREGPAQKQNSLGGTSTGFYQKVINSTRVDADATVGTLSIQERGFALRYYGGTVRATRKKFLTIPIVPEAHGKRAPEIKDLFRIGDTLGKAIGRGKTRTFYPMFLLRKVTRHPADPSLLPSRDVLLKAATDALGDFAVQNVQRT